MSQRIGIVTGGGDGSLSSTHQLYEHDIPAVVPTNFDRALCTLFGTTAVELAAEGALGRMVTSTGSQISSVPLADAIGQLRTVPLDGGFVRGARALGVCLGD